MSRHIIHLLALLQLCCQAAKVWSLEAFGHADQDPGHWLKQWFMVCGTHLRHLRFQQNLGKQVSNIINCQITKLIQLHTVKMLCTSTTMDFLLSQIKMQLQETQIPGFAWHSPLRPVWRICTEFNFSQNRVSNSQSSLFWYLDILGVSTWQ